MKLISLAIPLAALVVTSFLYNGSDKANIGITTIPSEILTYGIPLILGLGTYGASKLPSKNKVDHKQILSKINKLELETVNIPNAETKELLSKLREIVLNSYYKTKTSKEGNLT